MRTARELPGPRQDGTGRDWTGREVLDGGPASRAALDTSSRLNLAPQHPQRALPDSHSSGGRPEIPGVF